MALRLPWSDERYARVYCRDTLDWMALSWNAQALWCQLNRKATRLGRIDLGRVGLRGLAALVGRPEMSAEIEKAMAELLADGCVRQEGDILVIPDFVEAQEAVSSGAERMRKLRELRAEAKAAAAGRRDEALLAEPPSLGDEASPRDEVSRNVTRRYGTARKARHGTAPNGAPGPASPPTPRARARAKLVSPYPSGQDPHPNTTAVLGALFDLGLDAAPPSAESASRVEAAITTAGIPAAVERLAAILGDPEAPRPLTFHVEAIRGTPKRRRVGDLGVELESWPSKLTAEERAAWRREAVALCGTDWSEAPVGSPGDPSVHDVKALEALNMKWRAVAEGRG